MRTRKPKTTSVSRISEAELQKCVLHLASWLGYRIVHFKAAMVRGEKWVTPFDGDEGFPDTILIHKHTGWAIAAELKVRGRKATEGQQRWLNAFHTAGFSTELWRESDWLDGTIERRLREGLECSPLNGATYRLPKSVR